MAKRKKKTQSDNELDEILAQLKKTYVSDSKNSDLEDSLFDSSEKAEEDEEINRILSKIFSSDNENSVSEDVAPVNKEDGQEEDEIKTDISANSIETESDEDDEITKDIAEDTELLTEEESASETEHEVDEAESASVETVAAETEVADVFNVMFGGADASSGSVTNPEKAEPATVINEIVEDSFVEDTESSEYEDEEEFNDVDGESSFEQEDAEFFDNHDESDAEEFAVFDEEYASSDEENVDLLEEDDVVADNDTVVEESYTEESNVLNTELDAAGEAYVEADANEEPEATEVAEKISGEKACRLVLSPEEYTKDALQEGLATFRVAREIKETSYAEDSATDVKNTEGVQFDDSDISLLLKLGYDDEIKSKAGRDVAEHILKEKSSKFIPEPHNLPFGFCGSEFSDRNQTDEVRNKYRSDKKTCLTKLFCVGVIALVILSLYVFFEFFSGRTSYPLFLLVEFLLVALMCAVLYKNIYHGIMGIIKFEANLYSFSVFVLFAYVIYDIVTAIIYTVRKGEVDTSSLMIFGVAVSLYLVLTLVSDLLNCIRESNTFNIMTSKDRVYTVEKAVDLKRSLNGHNESVNSNKLAYSNENILRICDTSLISGYFRKTSHRRGNTVNLIYLLGIVPALSLLTGCISVISGGDVMKGVSAAMFTAVLSAPVFSVFIPSFAEYIFSKKLEKEDTAFIGIDSVEKYLKTDAISFRDNEAVVITGFKEIHPSNSGEIEKYLLIARDVFKSLSGTLSDLIDGEDKETQPDDKRKVIINEISENGIELYFNESINILMGSKQYMHTHKIKVKTDANLNAATKGADCSVIYMAFDGVPKLGFIINSKIRQEFSDVSSTLELNGIRLLVESYEPHINDIFFEQNKGDAHYSVSVIRPDEFISLHQKTICDGDIVSSRDGLSVAKAVAFSKRIIDVRKRNQRTNAMTIAAGLLVSCLLALLINTADSFVVFEWLRTHITLVFNVSMLLGAIPGVISLFKLKKADQD